MIENTSAPRNSRYNMAALMQRGANQFNGDRLLTLPAVCCKIGASRSSLYDWVNKGLFPKPIKIGPRRIAWKSSAVEAYIAQCEAA